MADRICSVPNCGKKPISRGWCPAHYRRWSLYGDPNGGGPLREPRSLRPCTIAGCTRLDMKIIRGMCTTCYGRWLLDGKPTVPRSPVRMSPKLSPEEKFWHYTDKRGSAECWLWTGSLSKGYGFFTVKGTRARVPAHRFSWELHNGPIPDGLLVRHKVCDNPPCVNPAHLDVGTHGDNSRDMVDHNRSTAGERHGNAVLTEDDVREIRARRAKGETYTQISRALGLAKNSCRNAVVGVTWRHI